MSQRWLACNENLKEALAVTEQEVGDLFAPNPLRDVSLETGAA